MYSLGFVATSTNYKDYDNKTHKKNQETFKGPLTWADVFQALKICISPFRYQMKASVTDPWRLPTLFYTSGVLGELVTPISTFHSFLKTHSQKQISLVSPQPPSPELPSSVLASWVGWGPKNKDARQTNFSIFCSFFPPNLKSEFLGGPVAWLWGRYPVCPKSFLVFHGFFLSLTRNMHGKPLYFSTKSQHLL